MSWPALGRAALERIVVQPGPRELVVEIIASIVSTGTERARFVGLPNARVEFPHRPGCSASGRVIGGTGVGGFRVGDEVALLNVPHQSVAAVPPERAFLVPTGATLPDAAILQLALVAGLGVHQAGLERQEPHGIVGVGLIGALAQRLARLQGAGPCTALARTAGKERVARAGGATTFLAVERKGAAGAIQRLDLPVVIEASGDPQALALAVNAAAPGGRVVLLGSPRGRAPLDLLQTVRRKRLRLIGAHITRFEGTPGLGLSGMEAMASQILQALAARTLVIADLLEDVDPSEATRLYRRLVKDHKLIGARFDWTVRLGSQTRMAGGASRNWAPSGAAPPARQAIAVPHERGEDPPRSGGPSSTWHRIDRPVRFGFVGCGEIAVLNAEAVARTPNASTVACYDIDSELARDLARRHGATAMPSLPALLERDDIDAVVLSLPHHLHAPAAVEAARAGKHVVVEKPLARDLRSAVEMVQAVERTGVALSVCFPERYGTGITWARRIVERGALGELFMIELLWYADKPLSYLFSGFTGRSSSTWRMRREDSGGGILLMNLCHGLDLVRHVTGLEVAHVSASVANVEKLGEVEDTFAIEIKYDNGAVGIMAGSSAVRDLQHENLRFLATDGWLRLRPVWEVLTSRQVAGIGIDMDRPVRLGPSLPPLVTRARYFSRFASAVRDGRPPDVTGEDGLRVQAVIEAAYEAAVSGTRASPAVLRSETVEMLSQAADRPANRSRQRPSPVSAHRQKANGRVAR